MIGDDGIQGAPEAAKVLILGAGSAGSRHARTLLDAGAQVSIADPMADRALAVDEAVAVPYDLDGLEGYDGIVVASPTIFHADQLCAALQASPKVLVEKPLATDSATVADLCDSESDRIMVGYNLRLHAPVERAIELVKQGRAGQVLAARVWFGSYLPDWRPSVDYRTTYSARSELGGGVLLDAIHELDLLVWLLRGPFQVVGAVVETTGSLEIDVEDTVKALLVSQSGVPVEVSLDYLSRQYRRGIEIVGEAATVRLDWARELLQVEDGEATESEPATTPLMESYRRQAKCFLSWLAGLAEPPVDGTTGLASLQLAEQIRAKASGR